MVRFVRVVTVLLIVHASVALSDDSGGVVNGPSGIVVPETDEAAVPVAAAEDDARREARDGIIQQWKYNDDPLAVRGLLGDSEFAEVGTALRHDGIAAGVSGTSHYETIGSLVETDQGKTMSADQAKSAFGSYTGHSYANSVQAAHSNVRNMRRGILRHVDDVNKTIGVAPTEDCLGQLGSQEKRFWIGGSGQWEHARDRDDGLTGYRYAGSGVMTGFDRTVGPVSVGGALAYSGGKFRDNSALANDSRIEGYAASLYATYNPDSDFRAAAMAGYAYSGVRLRRTRAGAGIVDGAAAVVEGVEHGKYGMDSFVLGGHIGYERTLWDIMQLGVTVGAFYEHSRSRGFDARFVSGGGDGGSLIRVGGMGLHSISAPVDVTADYVVYSDMEQSLTVSGNVGYGFEFANHGATGTLWYEGLGDAGVDFTGRSAGRNVARLGVGVAYENDILDVTGKYDVFMRSGYTAHGLTGNVGIKF